MPRRDSIAIALRPMLGIPRLPLLGMLIGVVALVVVSGGCRRARCGGAPAAVARSAGEAGVRYTIASLDQYAGIVLRQLEAVQPRPEEFSEPGGDVQRALRAASERWWGRDRSARLAETRVDIADWALQLVLWSSGRLEWRMDTGRTMVRQGAWARRNGRIVAMIHWEHGEGPGEQWVLAEAGEALTVVEPLSYAGLELTRRD